MRLVTQKDDDFSTCFDIIDESEDGIDNSSLKQILINNLTAENRGIIRGQLPPEFIFVFAKSVKKITNGLVFELDLRKSNRKHDILYTILGDNDVNVTIKSVSLYITSITPKYTNTSIFLLSYFKNFYIII